MSRCVFIVLCCMYSSLCVQAQKVFAEEALVAVVKQYHPLAEQARLEVQLADAAITKSRGAFDPVLEMNNQGKTFDGVRYYDQQGTTLKIPTWYGVDLYAGSENITGSRLNPVETKGGVYYMGVSVPLMQSMVIDKRRAALQQAKVFREQAAWQQRAALNELMVTAIDAYWQWWGCHQYYQLVQAALKNAQKRLQFVKTAYTLGDRPAIDTLEAFTQVQLFALKENEVNMEVQKARLALSAFLWKENQVPYLLPDDAVPQATQEAERLTLEELLEATRRHPEQEIYRYKIQGLQIERRLQFQSLLPAVNLKYQHLERSFSETLHSNWLDNNYRFGISVAVPLRLSEGRGAYKAARLKLDQARLAQLHKQWELETKVRKQYVEWEQSKGQMQRQQALVANYAVLQRGEEVRLQNGESSLFLLNARELKVIEGQQKQIEWEVKNRAALVRLKGAAGLFVRK